MQRTLRHIGDSPVSLAQNTAFATAAGYALSIPASDAVHTSIPKNGCTTLRTSIALASGYIEDASQFSWAHANAPALRASLREIVRANYTFIVLRDPFLRLASCFLDKLVGLSPVADTFRRVTGEKIQRGDLTFRAFVALLPECLREDHHWRPQSDFLIYDRYDDAFRFEAFADVVETLKRKIGFDVVDTRLKIRHGHDLNEVVEGDYCAADLPVFELLIAKEAGRVPPLRNFYDQRLIEEVAALYAGDIALYREWFDRPTVF